jgi:hypothetical protein
VKLVEINAETGTLNKHKTIVPICLKFHQTALQRKLETKTVRKVP